MIHVLTNYTGHVWNFVSNMVYTMRITTRQRTISSIEVKVYISRVKRKRRVSSYFVYNCSIILDTLRPPLDERRPRPLANWRTVDIVDLHSCPDDDCSMAVESVGIKISLLNNNVPGWCITI